MIGALGHLELLFGFSKDNTLGLLLPSVEVLFEPDFGMKQPKKKSKRDMNIGVLKKTCVIRSLYTMDDVLGLVSGNYVKCMYL